MRLILSGHRIYTLFLALFVCMVLFSCDSLLDAEEEETAGTNTNLIKNGTFSGNFDDDWYFYTSNGAVATADTDNNVFHLDIETGTNNEWNIGLLQTVGLEKETVYTCEFTAFATVDNSVISVGIQEGESDINDDGKNYSNYNRTWLNLSQTPEPYSVQFIMPGYDDPAALLFFAFDFMTGPNAIVLDDIVLKKETEFIPEAPPAAPEMIRNGDFSEGFNFWWWYSDAGHTIVPDCSDGSFRLGNLTPDTERPNTCIKYIKPGELETNTEYIIRFSAASSIANEQLEIKLSESDYDLDADGLNFTTMDNAWVVLTNDMTQYEVTLESPYTTTEIDMNIHFDETKGDITLDNISMVPK